MEYFSDELIIGLKLLLDLMGESGESFVEREEIVEGLFVFFCDGWLGLFLFLGLFYVILAIFT
jgi:hypothetical protein